MFLAHDRRALWIWAAGGVTRPLVEEIEPALGLAPEIDASLRLIGNPLRWGGFGLGHQGGGEGFHLIGDGIITQPWVGRMDRGR